jgi:hypothetical protein
MRESGWVWDETTALNIVTQWAQWETFSHDTISFEVPLVWWIGIGGTLLKSGWFVDPLLAPNGRGGWVVEESANPKTGKVSIKLMLYLDPREANPLSILINEGVRDADWSGFPTINEDSSSTDTYNEEI